MKRKREIAREREPEKNETFEAGHAKVLLSARTLSLAKG